MKLKAISFTELFSHPLFIDMCEEYTAECGNEDMGGHKPNIDLYLTMESLGRGFCIGAYEGDLLIGFAAVLLNEHPHYSKMMGVCDSLFIKRDYRKGPAGLRLIRKVQEIAKEKGAPGVYFSAPEGSRLSQLFARLFKATDRVYWARSKE